LAKKNKQKERKKLAHVQKLKVELEKDAQIRELEAKNSLLSRTLKAKPKTSRTLHARYSLPKSVLDLSRNKCVSINQMLKCHVTEFRKEDLEIFPYVLGSGVFGTVRPGKLSCFHQQVAVKEVSSSNRLEAYVEAKIMVTLNGHKSFPLIFGLVRPNLIVQEFIGTGTTSSPTLKNVLDSEQKNIVDWIGSIIDVCIAVKYMHDKGILHNDLHPKNILIRDYRYIKIVDFGKATLMEDPVVYSIAPGSKKHSKFNERHFHLAHELRNVSRSAQSSKTDIYTLGYDFQLISKVIKNEKIFNITCDLLKNNPDERPGLSRIIHKFASIRIK